MAVWGKIECPPIFLDTYYGKIGLLAISLDVLSLDVLPTEGKDFEDNGVCGTVPGSAFCLVL